MSQRPRAKLVVPTNNAVIPNKISYYGCFLFVFGSSNLGKNIFFSPFFGSMPLFVLSSGTLDAVLGELCVESPRCSPKALRTRVFATNQGTCTEHRGVHRGACVCPKNMCFCCCSSPPTSSLRTSSTRKLLSTVLLFCARKLKADQHAAASPAVSKHTPAYWTSIPASTRLPALIVSHSTG